MPFFPFCSLCRTVQDLVGKTEASGCHKVHSRSCVDVNYTLCVSVEVCAASPWVVFEKKIATILVQNLACHMKSQKGTFLLSSAARCAHLCKS